LNPSLPPSATAVYSWTPSMDCTTFTLRGHCILGIYYYLIVIVLEAPQTKKKDKKKLETPKKIIKVKKSIKI